MLTTNRARIRAVAAVGIAAAATALATVTLDASAAENTADRRLVAVPIIAEAIKPPAGSRMIGAYVVTTGTQTYTCVVPAGTASGAFTGASVPEAQLIGTGGRIHHFGGPSWQSVRDGSLVTAVREASSPRAGTIPELLLKVNSHSGKGILSRADYISRLRTSGGVAPAGACTAGQTAAVAYQSIYVFWDAPTV